MLTENRAVTNPERTLQALTQPHMTKRGGRLGQIATSANLITLLPGTALPLDSVVTDAMRMRIPISSQ